MNHKRIVITGFGCTTATGNVDTTWQAIKDRKSGITEISQWDISDWEFSVAGEIKDYNPRKMIADRKLLKLLSRQDVIGLSAAEQALAHSQLPDYQASLSDATEFNDQTGVFVGSPGNKFRQQYDFMPLLHLAQDDMQKYAAHLFEQVHPMWLLKILPNNVLAYVGIQNGFKGPNHNVTNHGVSGTQAILEAYHALQSDTMQRAVVVGYDTAFEPQGVIYYGALGALSHGDAVRSFDQNHDGTLLGEGAGALILETLESAKQRQATIYGEILGGATTTEAKGVFAIDAAGEGLERAMGQALTQANLQPSDIGMLTAHANGTPLSDASEAHAITKLFGANSVPVTGFKWSLGHTISAAGVIESILTLHALREKTVPGIPTLENLAADCATLNVSNDNQSTRSETALVTTRAFASLNTCLILRNFA